MKSRKTSLRYFWQLATLLLALGTVVLLSSFRGTDRKKAAPGDLKEFEGYYRLKDDSEMYIQIMIPGDKLVLKQMWDNMEIPFERKSDLEFYNTERQFPLLFTRSGGKITEVLAFKQDVWKKVDAYTVVKKKEIQLSPKEMKSFEGTYQLADRDEQLRMVAKGNHIVVTELWSGKEIEIAPESAVKFFGEDTRYPVTFTKDEKGSIKEALIFGRDVWKRL